jgi:hypothetical protein
MATHTPYTAFLNDEYSLGPFNIDPNIVDHAVYPIPQVDGPGQELYEFTTLSPNNVTRSTNYAFNQDKQTEKIRKDALINDYEVTVNNLDQNANIKCSVGFYIQVERASLGTLKNPSVLSSGNITISIDRITVSNEKNGIEATRLINFSFMSEQKSPDNIQSALDSEPEDTELPPNPPAASASRQDANESFASIEEFITDAELGFEDPLNFQLPTTQP